MKRVSLTDSSVVGICVDVLRAGGVLMHPTETCYGLAADIFSEVALKKLYVVKGMPAEKPLSILVNGLEMALEYGIFSDKAMELAEKYWPGPLSIMVPAKVEKLPRFFNPGQEFISIRSSALDFCSEIVGLLGHPVTTTSANRFGEAELYLPTAIEGVDLLVDGGELSKNKPSTIVKVVSSQVDVLRKGDVVLEK